MQNEFSHKSYISELERQASRHPELLPYVVPGSRHETLYSAAIVAVVLAVIYLAF